MRSKRAVETIDIDMDDSVIDLVQASPAKRPKKNSGEQLGFLSPGCINGFVKAILFLIL